MDTKTEFIITPNDGANTCLWKILQGRDWLPTYQIVELLADCHYSPAKIRQALAVAPASLIEKREIRTEMNRKAMEYRLVKDAEQPAPEKVRTTKKQRDYERGRYSGVSALADFAALALRPRTGE